MVNRCMAKIKYFETGRGALVMLIGGTKSTQDNDIDTARRYWAEHKGRQKKGGK